MVRFIRLDSFFWLVQEELVASHEGVTSTRLNNSKDFLLSLQTDMRETNFGDLQDILLLWVPNNCEQTSE